MLFAHRFDQIIKGSVLNSLAGISEFLISADKHNLDLAALLMKLSDHIDSAAAGHTDITDNQIRTAIVYNLSQLVSIISLSYDSKPKCLPRDQLF
ncbi:hypothetical protein D3C78_1546880 [compost metagenome]